MRYFESFEKEVKAAVKGLLTRKWKIDKVERNTRGIVESVRIHAKCFGINYYMWIDINSTDGTWDWNQYIFNWANSFDCIYHSLQYNERFYDIVDSLVADYI